MALIRDPATGQLVDDSNVGLGQGLVNTANNLGTVIRGTGQGLLNAAGGAVIAPFDAVRQGLTAAAGGSVSSLGAPLADQAWQLSQQGFSDAGNAASRIGQGLTSHAQGAVLGLLGAQPAQAAAPAQAALPAPAQAPALPAPVTDPASAPAPAGLLNTDNLAPINAAIAQGLAAGQAAQAPVQAGGPMGNDFNAGNTAVGTSGAPGNNGINFFAGGESPQAYLQRMSLQDRQGMLDNQAEANRLNQASIISHINDPFTSPQQQKLLLNQLKLLAPQTQQVQDQGTQFATQVANSQATAANAQLQRAAMMQQAQLNNAGKLAVAGIAANATLGAGQARAQGMIGAAGLRAAAQGGSQAAAQAQAQILHEKLATTQAILATTDPAQKMRLQEYLNNLNGQEHQDKDPITGLSYTPQAAQAGQAIQLLQLQNQLQKQVQQ